MKRGHHVDGTDEARKLVAKLTLEEKAALLSGKDTWSTRDFEGIPSIFMTDGPHGLRKSIDGFVGVPATAFPTASALASSWNPELVHKVGAAIGEEAQANDVQVVLGPGVNMKRSPLGGRNFEYFSEDPVLTADMAIAHVNGVQSQGVGTSLKHFAANNQEYERMTNSSDIAVRPLHEIYLRAFELTVKKAKPWSLMASYNLINGKHATESGWLLQDLLRDEWGHKGIVVSDWGAAATGRVQALIAGTHLEMPGGGDENTKAIVDAVSAGILHESVVTARAEQLTENILKVARSKHEDVTFSEDDHHLLARTVAHETMVLLKNDNKVLPVLAGHVKSIAIIGTFAKKPRYQGSGSSQITPTTLDVFYDELVKTYGNHIDIRYAAGWTEEGTTTEKLIAGAKHAATHADVVLVLAGLPSSYESEGFDRSSIDLPAGQNEVIAALADVSKKIVVALSNGSAVAMPWLHHVQAVIEMWLSGQASAGALVDIICGKVNPSGKLSETFPARLQDTPAYPDFPNKTGHAHYGEGIFIGYRWYDMREITPLFEFGYGLSYTTFKLSKLSLAKSRIKDNETVSVGVTIKNTGDVVGKEVVQLYIAIKDQSEVHPVRELKKFQKISLRPSEEKKLIFTLTPEDFSFYSEKYHAWQPASGDIDIFVGQSSRELLPPKTLKVVAHSPRPVILTRDSLLKEFAAHPRGRKFIDLIGGQMAKQFLGDETKGKKPDDMLKLILTMVGDLPLSRLPSMSNGLLTSDFVDAVVSYTHHQGGFHPLEAFPYYAELAKLAAKAASQAKKKQK